MAVILITVIGSSDHDQITMGIETLRNIVIITTDIFAVHSLCVTYSNLVTILSKKPRRWALEIIAQLIWFCVAFFYCRHPGPTQNQVLNLISS
jgi:hypothetical protein